MELASPWTLRTEPRTTGEWLFKPIYCQGRWVHQNIPEDPLFDFLSICLSFLRKETGLVPFIRVGLVHLRRVLYLHQVESEASFKGLNLGSKFGWEFQFQIGWSKDQQYQGDYFLLLFPARMFLGIILFTLLCQWAPFSACNLGHFCRNRGSFQLAQEKRILL